MSLILCQFFGPSPSCNDNAAVTHALPPLPFTAAVHDSAMARSSSSSVGRRVGRIADCFPMICGVRSEANLVSWPPRCDECCRQLPLAPRQLCPSHGEKSLTTFVIYGSWFLSSPQSQAHNTNTRPYVTYATSRLPLPPTPPAH